MNRPISIALSAFALTLITACAAPRNDVAQDPVPQPAHTTAQRPLMAAPISSQYGYVSNVETVTTEARQGRSGAVLGAVLGAVAGNQIGSGNGQKAAIAVGAVGGAVAGNQIQNRNKRDDQIYRVSVRFDDGHESSFDFEQIDALRAGDRVKYEGGQLYRL